MPEVFCKIAYWKKFSICHTIIFLGFIQWSTGKCGYFFFPCCIWLSTAPISMSLASTSWMNVSLSLGSAITSGLVSLPFRVLNAIWHSSVHTNELSDIVRSLRGFAIVLNFLTYFLQYEQSPRNCFTSVGFLGVGHSSTFAILFGSGLTPFALTLKSNNVTSGLKVHIYLLSTLNLLVLVYRILF